MKCRMHIEKNTPNSAQRRALQRMVGKEFNELLERYNRDAILQFLYVMRFVFGFGQKRLQRAADSLTKMQNDLDYRYELPQDDTPWLCEQKLIESGIDVKALLKEKGDKND